MCAQIRKQLPILDTRALERTAAYLTPEAVIVYLRTLADLGETLLCGLHTPGALTRTGDALADAAHKLAGSAAMFGFERVAAAARKFEHAVQAGAADAPAMADSLGAAVEATCKEIHARTQRSRW